MKPLSPQQINSIAQYTSMSMICYIHKQTGEIIALPDFKNDDYADEEDFEEDVEKVENNSEDYFVLKPLQSSDSFEIMEEFVNQLSIKNALKNRLIKALNMKKPFREFNFIIDNSGEYKQKWFDFKDAKMEQWVINRFNEELENEN